LLYSNQKIDKIPFVVTNMGVLLYELLRRRLW